MTQIHLNYGANPNDGTGSPLQTLFDEIESNFNDLYLNAGVPTVITVRSSEDFPEPVGGYHTLAESTDYIVSSSFSIGANGLIFQNGSRLQGINGTNSVITSNTSASFIKATNQNVVITDMSLVLNGAGDFFEFTNTVATKALSFRSCALIGVGGAQAGTITGMRIGGFTGCSLSGLGGFLEFDGAINRLSIHNSTLSDLQIRLAATAIIGDCAISVTQIVEASGKQFITDLGATITDQINIVGGVFSGAGTLAAAGYEINPNLNISNNSNINPSRHTGQGGIIDSALNTTFSGTGSGNAVLVNFGTAFTSDIEDQFTISTAGRFTYNGKTEREFLIACSLFADVSGGANRTYIYFGAVNGVPTVSSSSKVQYDGSNPDSSSVNSVVTLGNGDYVELWVYAVTSASPNLNVDTCSISIIGQS